MRFSKFLLRRHASGSGQLRRWDVPVSAGPVLSAGKIAVAGGLRPVASRRLWALSCVVVFRKNQILSAGRGFFGIACNPFLLLVEFTMLCLKSQLQLESGRTAWNCISNLKQNTDLACSPKCTLPPLGACILISFGTFTDTERVAEGGGKLSSK